MWLNTSANNVGIKREWDNHTRQVWPLWEREARNLVVGKSFHGCVVLTSVAQANGESVKGVLHLMELALVSWFNNSLKCLDMNMMKSVYQLGPSVDYGSLNRRSERYIFMVTMSCHIEFEYLYIVCFST